LIIDYLIPSLRSRWPPSTALRTASVADLRNASHGDFFNSPKLPCFMVVCLYNSKQNRIQEALPFTTCDLRFTIYSFLPRNPRNPRLLTISWF